MKKGGDGIDRLARMLKDYVAQNPPVCGDAQAVSDQLYWAFMERHRNDNGKINECYAALRDQVKLPMREYDKVLYTVSSLAMEYGRVAFMEGLKIGMLLMQNTIDP